MMSLQQNALQYNTKFSFDFSGGNLSSDSGLLFIKEFIHKIGFDNLLDQSSELITERLTPSLPSLNS
ncbi:hypothetical protein [Proteiniclasticum ruminis]|uniref:Transposase DDE domain group 1 n=1 Tax=Proteiniclasticum ruminis TaxID=398199 RepID=A0A1I5DQU5_9CLOT|nr:hypothetical protein [Proteiniclasticum ruminis]SFO01547.1 hypothetical protein SAMN04488695_11059 [Proteiniclasticum ruminis]